MKKLRLSLFLAVILLSVGLVACANGSKKENKPSLNPEVENGSEGTEEGKAEDPPAEETPEGSNTDGSITDGSNTEGSNTEGSITEDPSDNEDPIKQYTYTVMVGDYFSFGGDSIEIEDAQIVKNVRKDLLQATKVGTTTITTKSQNFTSIYKVTVAALDTSFIEEGYLNLSTEEVTKAIETERNSFIDSYAEYTPVTDRTDVRVGDKAAIYFVGTLNGEAFEGGTGSYDLVIGSHSFIDGFEEGLVGVTVGSTVDLNLTFPENYGEPTLAGKEVVFTVTVNAIQSLEEYSDALVNRVTGGEYQTVDAFEEYLKKTTVSNLLFDKLTKQVDTGLISEEIRLQYFNNYINDMIDYIASMGIAIQDKEGLMALYGYDEETFDKLVWSNVESVLVQDCTFFGLCQKENITLSEQTYENCLAIYLKRYNCQDIETLISSYNVDYATLYETFLYEEVVQYLYRNAIIA